MVNIQGNTPTLNKQKSLCIEIGSWVMAGLHALIHDGKMFYCKYGESN